jgi:hypothetical protein
MWKYPTTLGGPVHAPATLAPGGEGTGPTAGMDKRKSLALHKFERHPSVAQPGDQSLHQPTRLIPYVYEITGIFDVDIDVKYQHEGITI